MTHHLVLFSLMHLDENYNTTLASVCGGRKSALSLPLESRYVLHFLVISDIPDFLTPSQPITSNLTAITSTGMKLTTAYVIRQASRRKYKMHYRSQATPWVSRSTSDDSEQLPGFLFFSSSGKYLLFYFV